MSWLYEFIAFGDIKSLKKAVNMGIFLFSSFVIAAFLSVFLSTFVFVACFYFDMIPACPLLYRNQIIFIRFFTGFILRKKIKLISLKKSFEVTTRN